MGTIRRGEEGIRKKNVRSEVVVLPMRVVVHLLVMRVVSGGV